jgi:hypothetical protein
MAIEHVLEVLRVARASQPMSLLIRWRPGHAQVEVDATVPGVNKVAVAVLRSTIAYQRRPNLPWPKPKLLLVKIGVGTMRLLQVLPPRRRMLC